MNLSGRASETVANITESSMLILTYGTDIPKETSMLSCVDKSLPLKPNVEDFRNLEKIGIKDSPTESDSCVALNMFSDTLRYENGRFALTWPWKVEKTIFVRKQHTGSRTSKVTCKKNEG